MRATTAGVVIGKALEAYTGSGQGQINAYISVGYTDPNDLLAHFSIDGNGALATDGAFAVNGNLSATSASFGSASQLTVAADGSLTTSASVSASLLAVANGTIGSDANGNVINTLTNDLNNNLVTKYIYRNAAGRDLMALDSNGNATISGTLTTSTGNYDVAEDYATKDNSIEAGNVIANDKSKTVNVQK